MAVVQGKAYNNILITELHIILCIMMYVRSNKHLAYHKQQHYLMYCTICAQ